MPREPETISLRPLRSCPSSQWSISTRDSERVREDLHLPSLPRRSIWPIRLADREAYCVGDPIFLGSSDTPFLFQGFTGNRYCNDLGEEVHEGIFYEQAEIGSPLPGFTLPLYYAREDMQTTVQPVIPWWRRLWRYLIDHFRG